MSKIFELRMEILQTFLTPAMIISVQSRGRSDHCIFIQRLELSVHHA